MRQHGFNVGGEQSGHIVLSDFATTGDGLVAALQVLACVSKLGRPVSEVCRRFEPVPQILKNVRYQGSAPLDNPDVQSVIEEGRKVLGNSGRLVIRPSGTEALIRVMGEADNQDVLAGVVDRIVDAVTHAAA